MPTIALIGPTSSPLAEIAEEVEADLRRLRRPGLELRYLTTGAGPTSIRSAADAAAAAPSVVATTRLAVAEGADGIIVDCTDDPGVAEAERIVDQPVVGAGAALRRAVSDGPRPARHLDGDLLRGTDFDDLLVMVAEARTVAIGATGFAAVADRLARLRPDLVVIEPLSAAVDLCLDRISAG